jgi:hypothetical protein
MKKVYDYVTKHDDVCEENISEYITSYHNVQIKKSTDEACDVLY